LTNIVKEWASFEHGQEKEVIFIQQIAIKSTVARAEQRLSCVLPRSLTERLKFLQLTYGDVFNSLEKKKAKRLGDKWISGRLFT